MAKKPDLHDQTEKQLQKTVKFPLVPHAFALLLKTYLINFVEISPAWVPTRTRLKLIEASRQPAPAASTQRAIPKPAGYNKAIGQMISADVTPHAPENIVGHLQAAIYFFENWGHQHPSAQLTCLMQLAACKLMVAAERHIGALHYHETREGIRTSKSGITKRTAAGKKKSLVLKLDDEINPSWARYTAAQRIYKLWKESDGKISVKRIADYLRESGRRPPKTPKRSKKAADM